MAERGTVLVRRRALGDVVLLGAVTASVPGPVTVVTERRFLPIARRLRGVDRAVALGEGRPEGRVIDLQRDARTVAAFPGAHRIHKGTLGRRLRLLGLGGPARSVPERYARACGAPALPPPWLPAEGPREGLVLIPGASAPLKRLAPAVLIAAGRAFPGPVTVLGGPGEAALVAGIAAEVPGADALVEEGFERTLALLARSAVALGGDTGLSHLAAASGARVVVGLGPTHEDDGFWPHAARVFGLTLPCRPCALHRVEACRQPRPWCRELSAVEVARAVVECAGSS